MFLCSLQQTVNIVGKLGESVCVCGHIKIGGRYPIEMCKCGTYWGHLAALIAPSVSHL